MAIAQTGAIYKALTFDGTSSRTFGVYITGEAVYNAPKRDVEMISIPGRNGAYSLDRGRFQNIEVTYPAGIFADNETDFRDAVSDFRNFLCSKNGYVRLTDEYNPNEYRMAVYKSGLEVTPAMLTAGQFDITFECMPQRWLTSGETKTTIATSGDTITNPTLFESRPLLEVEGYGEILINGESVNIENATIGKTAISSTKSSSGYSTIVVFDVSALNTGDTISISGITINVAHSVNAGYTVVGLDSDNPPSFTNCTGNVSSDGATYSLKINNTSFVYKTSTTFTGTSQASVNYTDPNNNDYAGTTYVNFSMAYTNNDRIVLALSGAKASCFSVSSINVKVPVQYGISTKSALTNPLYVDLDIGAAYGEVSGVITSLNNAVILPAKLPTLVSGSNIITYDNTITELKVTPRWWKV